MTNRYGEVVEVVVGHGAPFFALESDLVESVVERLKAKGLRVVPESGVALVDSFDPDDPGEIHVNIVEGQEDLVQDALDSLTVDDRRRVVEAEK